MIKDDFVSYDVALLLQEKGFSGYCDRYYSEKDVIVKIPNAICIKGGTKGEPVFAPSVNMAMKWLRTKRVIIVISPAWFSGDGSCSSWYSHIWADDNFEGFDDKEFDSYEEAVEYAIRYALENIITKEDKE